MAYFAGEPHCSWTWTKNLRRLALLNKKTKGEELSKEEKDELGRLEAELEFYKSKDKGN